MKCISFKAGFALVGSLAASLLLMGGAQAQVNVNIYSGFTEIGGGAPYTGLVGSFTSPDIAFATNTGYSWLPLGQTTPPGYGADITGCFNPQTTGLYTFGLNSDDGSLFFLNGVLNVSNPGPHAPLTVFGAPIALTAADVLPIEVQFFEDRGLPAGVDLLVRGPGDDSFRLATPTELSCVPEPGSLALLATGGLPLLGFLRRRRLAG